jgi:hypothetical protein
VLEFKNCYLAALLYWAPMRRDLYRLRLEREKAILELKILEQGEILRYIPMAAELDLASKEDDDEATQLLEERKFIKLNSALLLSPQYTKVDELRGEILEGPKISYSHVLDLKERDLVKRSVEKRAKKLGELRGELAAVLERLAEKPFAGVSIWRSEIAAFRKLADEGIATRWRYKIAADDDEPAEDPAL